VGAAASGSARVSGCSRRSQLDTAMRNEGSAASRASAARRSSASSVPSTYSPASASISSGSATKAILQCNQAPSKERLDSRDRAVEASGELLPAPTIAIGKKHHGAALAFELVETGGEARAGKQPLAATGRIG